MRAHNLKQNVDTDLDRARVARSNGATAQARKILDRILHRHPNDAPAQHLRGVVALEAGNAQEALAYLFKAVDLAADNADYWCDLGTALQRNAERAQAQDAYLRALAVQPDHLDAIFNLANGLRESKQLQEALQFYSALLERKPDYRGGWNNTGLALLDLRHLDEARRCIEREIAVDESNLDAYVNLGHVMREQGLVEDAIAIYRKGLGYAPNHPGLNLNLGVALNTLGATGEALARLRDVVRLQPTNATAHQSLIFTLDFDVTTGTHVQQAARRAWYRECVQPAKISPLGMHRNAEPDRKLRVGYVSADFRMTSAAMTFAPLLLQYDRARFEVHCFSNSVTEDALTARIRSAVTSYRVIAGMTDEQAVRLINGARIDILVDLSGHMVGNRLQLFAHRPAPLQITGWGYANGTGMPEMDYIAADAVYLPDTDCAHFAEKRLDAPAVIAYQPFDSLPPLTAAPCIERGYVAFGSYSRLQKLTQTTLRLWARVLTNVPGSVLILKASQEIHAQGLERIRHRFVDEGIDATRIRFLPRAGWVEHMQSFREIDIQLDPYPHGGGISLLDGIAMGVPTLTLIGETPSARLGASLLRAVGVSSDWVARSEDEYVAQAVSWSARRDVLRGLRFELRERLLQSPVGNTLEYTRILERAFSQAWKARAENLAVAREQALQAVRAALTRARPDTQWSRIESLLNGDPKDREVLELAGVACMQMDRIQESIQYLEQALRIDDSQAETWINLGATFSKCGRTDDAIHAIEQALRRNPDSVHALYNLGCIMLVRNQWDRAADAFENTLRCDPGHVLAMNNRGIVHERQGRPQQAAECFRQAMKMDPDMHLGFANYGRSLIAQDRMEEAIPYLERALALDSTAHWLRYELAVWYERLDYRDRLPSLAKVSYVPSTAPRGRELCDTVDERAYVRITGAVIADLERRGTSAQSMGESLLNLSSSLIELDHPAKTQLMNRTIELDPSNIAAYRQAGISLHHDAEYDAAAKRWQEGLRLRDQTARSLGLLEIPHRVLDTTWYMAVGHLQMLDIYLKSIELGLRPRRDLWLLRTRTQKVPNEHYLRYWAPWVHLDAPITSTSNLDSIGQQTGVVPSQLGFITDHFFADRIPDVHELWHMEFAATVQKQWEDKGGAPLLHLTEEDRQYGQEVLERLGVPHDAWFVCLHAREPGFWSKWDRYHASIRNANIDSYALAIDAVLARGGWVIRMGDSSMRPLPARHGVVDYALSGHKSERMDVFLCAAARLFIGVNSGLSLLPPTFGRPCLLTNFVPISIPFPYGQDRMLPKLFRSKKDGRFLRFEEMFAHGVAGAQFAKHVPDWLEVLDNAPEDIADAVNEMLDDSSGEVALSDRIAHLQLRERYDAMLRSQGNFLGSAPAGCFLQRYADLL